LLKKPVVSVVAIVVIALVLLTSAGPALAHGLILEAVEEAGGGKLLLSGNGKLFDFKNMYPGDRRQATLTIKNSCSRPCSFDMQVKKNRGLGLPSLLGQLELTVTKSDTVLYQGPFDRLGPIKLGSYAPGDSHDLSLEVYLPEETGNDYQGLSAAVKFIFTVKASGNGGNGDNGNGDDNGNGGNGGNGDNGGNGGNGDNGGSGSRGGGGKPRPEPKPPEGVDILPEDPPIDKPELPPDLPETEVPAEPVPTGISPVMPKTGEALPYPYYLLGGMVLLAGTKLAYTDKRRWDKDW
jgi:uncharacterized membrane protein YgcG